MTLVEVAGLCIGLAGLGFVVFDTVYKSPKFIAPKPWRFHSVGLKRSYNLQIGNRRASLWRRDSAERVQAQVGRVVDEPGVLVPFRLFWIDPNNLDQPPQREVPIQPGRVFWLPLVFKDAGNLACQWADESRGALPEGTYAVEIQVGWPGSWKSFWYVIDNRGTEASGLVVKGPYRQHSAIRLARNPAQFHEVATLND